jgi:hypothetical protein
MDFMDFMKFLSVIKRYPNILFTKRTMKAQFETIVHLKADTQLLKEICYLLHYRPETWIYIHHGTEFYANTIQDIQDVYPTLMERPIIVTSATHRWTLVKVDDRILPFIFITKGGTRLSRIIFGTNSNWLLTLYDEVSLLVRSRTYAGGELPPPDPVPDSSRITFAGRSAEWNASGVHW